MRATLLAIVASIALGAGLEAEAAPVAGAAVSRAALAQAPAARPPAGAAKATGPAAKATPASAKAASGAAATATAAAKDKDKADKDKDDKDREGPGHKKTREGSVLKSDKLLPGYVDLRSDAERKRDDELKTHFARIAELDVIAGVAADSGDSSLGEYVEQVRRKELQRHQKVMMALKRAMAQSGALAASGAGEKP